MTKQMKQIAITCATNRDSIEPIFDAGIEYGLSFSNFIFDTVDDDIITFSVTFPADFSEDDFVAMCREYQFDELADLLID